jgi:tetratricopeptide (TPR) repeat protein
LSHLPADAWVLLNQMHLDSHIAQIEGGLHAGYSMLEGYYADELKDGPFFSVSATSPLSSFFKGFFNAALASHELSGSDGSQLYSFSLNAGPLASVNVARGFSLYAAPFGRLEYLYLKAQKLDREENTAKLGFGAESGFLFAIAPTMNLSAGIHFSQVWLSGTPLRSIAFHAGLQYNMFHIPSSAKIRAERAEEKLSTYSRTQAVYTEGVAFFEKGDTFAAKERFSETIRLKNDHLEAREYLEKISAIEKDYRLGMEHLEKKNVFAAIPPLERAGKFMKAAQQELEKTRTALAPQVLELERKGIRAYEMSNYETCIELMMKVKLIDPQNKTAHIYLPRARQRLEAANKLKNQ